MSGRVGDIADSGEIKHQITRFIFRDLWTKKTVVINDKADFLFGLMLHLDGFGHSSSRPAIIPNRTLALFGTE